MWWASFSYIFNALETWKSHPNSQFYIGASVRAYYTLKFYFSSFLQVRRSFERLRSRDFVQIHSFQPSHSRIDTSSIEKIRLSF
jgi:hypothetical protein